MLQVFQTIRKSFGSEISLNYDKMLTENALKKTKKKNEEKNENRKTRLILHFTILIFYPYLFVLIVQQSYRCIVLLS